MFVCVLYNWSVERTACADGEVVESITSLSVQDCMYLHELGDNDASFTKEDMQLG